MWNGEQARTLSHTESKVLSWIYFLFVMKESKLEVMVMKPLEDIYN